jgi:hypothetical protein
MHGEVGVEVLVFLIYVVCFIEEGRNDEFIIFGELIYEFY